MMRAFFRTRGGNGVSASDVMRKLDLINRRLDTIMATLDQVLADINDETSLIGSVSTLISGLKDQLAAALANSGITPEVQAKIDQVFTAAEANKAALAAAVAANTPAAPADQTASAQA